MMLRLRTIALFFAILAFFALTLPANHSEAEDAYFYARQVEQGLWNEMFHAHHLLYLPTMRVLFRAAQTLGYTGRSLPVLIGFSMVCGAGAICLFQALLRQRGARERLVWGFSMALLFSYGFWRYSTTAEIYIPVTALSLTALYFADRAPDRHLFFGLSVLSASLALLTHLIALPVVLIAIPLWIAKGQGIRKVILYCVLTVLIVALAYVVAAAAPGLTAYQDTQVVRETLLSPRTWVKGMAAGGQNLLSANFLFALPMIAGKIESLFPYHMLQEELFMGQQVSRWVPGLAPVTLGIAAACFLGLLWVTAQSLRREWATDSQRKISVLIWVGGSAGMALWFEPANPEMWICTLAPLWLFAALSCARVEGEHRTDWIALGLALALLVHNLVGGISLVKSPGGDYCQQKAAGAIELLREGDLVLTAESHGFVTFLQYRTMAQVVDAKFVSPSRWQALREQTTGRIFVFEDVMNLLPPAARRSEESVRQIRQVAELLKPGLHPLGKDEFGTLYQWL